MAQQELLLRRVRAPRACEHPTARRSRHPTMPTPLFRKLQRRTKVARTAPPRATSGEVGADPGPRETPVRVAPLAAPAAAATGHDRAAHAELAAWAPGELAAEDAEGGHLAYGNEERNMSM